MEPFQYHIYVCTQNKPDGIPCCHRDGAEAIVARLRKEIAGRGLAESVQLTTCGCLGLCEKGPNMIVYPEGTWYTGLKPDQIPEIISGHIENGRPVDGMALAETAAAQEEIVAHNRKVAGMKLRMEQAGVIPDELNRYLRGFMESRLLLSAIELGLFTAVGSGATAADVAAGINADKRATEMILNALVAIELMEKDGDLFRNGAIAADYLVEGARHDSIQATRHPARLWHSWSTLTEAVKAGTSVTGDRGARDEEQTRAFIAAMHKNAEFRGKMVVAQLDLAGVNRLLDLGGGSGAYTIAFLAQKPDMRATLFDLPSVIPLSKNYVAQAKLSDRVDFMAGSMISDPLGEGYDLVWVSAICHMWGETENRELIRRVYESLNPGGRIIIQDFVLEESKTAPRMAAIFALNMLVNTKSGATYTGAEYHSWMQAAGFREVVRKPLPGPTDLVIGRK